MPIRVRSNSRFVTSDPILTRDGDETFGIAKKFLFMDRKNLEEKDIITHTVTPSQARKLDVLAEDIYGNVDLHWIFPIFNRIENPLAWPLNGQVIEYPAVSRVSEEL